MARIIWTEPALHDLEAIANYISLDKPDGGQETGSPHFRKSADTSAISSIEIVKKSSIGESPLH